MPTDLLTTIVQLGSFGVLVYGIVYLLPQFWRRQLADVRRLARSIDKLTVTILYHDATCRGQSPQTLGSTDELLKLLRGDEDDDGEK